MFIIFTKTIVIIQRANLPSDNESLVSESSNLEISDFGSNETGSEADKITFISIVQQALQRQLELFEIFWTIIIIVPEGCLATTLSEKLTGHLLKNVVVFSKNRFAVHGIYLFIDESILRCI